MIKQAIATVISIGTLAALPVPAWANWVFVGENLDGDRYHVHEGTVLELTEGIVIFDTLIDYSRPQSDGAVATIDRFVADCRTGRVSNVSWAAFADSDAILNTNSMPSLEADVAPDGTLMASEIEFACQVANR